MIRRLPLLATLLVLAAVATMIGLGIWQLGRAEWKADLKTRYAAAAASDGEIRWPDDPAQFANALYRRSRLTCSEVLSRDAISGRNAAGEAGWAQIAHCRLPDGAVAPVQLGWSRDPANANWDGGEARGRIARYGDGLRLIADPPLAGLEASAPPDPSDLPDNHLAYAWQWFFFAATAMVIFVVALRRRLAPGGDGG